MSIAVPFVRALVEAVERCGVPRRDFLIRALLSESRLAEGDERFTAVEFDALQRLALDMTGDEALGLHLAEHASEAAFDVLGHLVSHAPSLREALGLCATFSLLLYGDTRLRMEERIDTVCIRHDFRRTSPRTDRMHAEFAVAAFSRMIRAFAGPAASLSGAYFEHAAPPHRHEYRRLFGGVEKFNQGFTGIEFPRRLLDARQLHQHPRLFALLHAEAHRTLENLGP